MSGRSHDNTSRLSQSVLGTSNVVQARKLREQKENDVKKLHIRIAMLQAEEEKALKRIDETRQKAQNMIEFKIQQEKFAKERTENRH